MNSNYVERILSDETGEWARFYNDRIKYKERFPSLIMTIKEKRNFIIQEILSNTEDEYNNYLTNILKYVDDYDLVVNVKQLVMNQAYWITSPANTKIKLILKCYSDGDDNVFLSYNEKQEFGTVFVDHINDKDFYILSAIIIFYDENECDRFIKDMKEQ